MTRLLMSHAAGYDGSSYDGSSALELEFHLDGDTATEAWSGRMAPDNPQPPDGFVDGPVVVTVLDGPEAGRRADAEIHRAGTCIEVVGISAFTAPADTPLDTPGT